MSGRVFRATSRMGGTYIDITDQERHLRRIIPDTGATTETDTTSQEAETVVIRYWVLFGDTRLEEPPKSFTFLQQAPRSLCRPVKIPKMDSNTDIRQLPEDYQNYMGFIEDLRRNYHRAYPSASPCVICKRRTMYVREVQKHHLCPPPGIKIEGFVPMVLSVVVPACPRSQNGGNCSAKALERAEDYGNAVGDAGPLYMWDWTKNCQTCRRRLNFEFCRRCKLVGLVFPIFSINAEANTSPRYCSEDCRLKDLASHSSVCMLAKNNETIHWDA